jgi:uncharacterized membrane protein
MSKQQFLQELNDGLKEIPETERVDILRDYEEYFQAGAENGKTEQEILDGLGSAKQIAKELRAAYHLGTVREKPNVANLLRATFALISLTLFNLVFVLGPLLGLFGLLVGCWFGVLSMIAAPIWTGIQDTEAVNAMGWFPWFGSIAICGAGILLGVALFFFSKWLVKGLVWYMQFNLSIVKGGAKREGS